MFSKGLLGPWNGQRFPRRHAVPQLLPNPQLSLDSPPHAINQWTFSPDVRIEEVPWRCRQRQLSENHAQGRTNFPGRVCNIPPFRATSRTPTATTFTCGKPTATRFPGRHAEGDTAVSNNAETSTMLVVWIEKR